MNEEALQYELRHLLNLCAPPYQDAWEGYVRYKAKALARHYPEDYETLPALLEEALSRSP